MKSCGPWHFWEIETRKTLRCVDEKRDRDRLNELRWSPMDNLGKMQDNQMV